MVKKFFFTKYIEYFIGIMLIILSLSVFISVLTRYIFKIAIPEIIIIQKFTVSWLVFLGAALAVKENKHLNIEIFLEFLSARNRYIKHIFVNLVLFVSIIIFFMAGREAILISFDRKELIPIRFIKHYISLAYFNMPFFIAGILMVFFQIINIKKSIIKYNKYLKSKKEENKKS